MASKLVLWQPRDGKRSRGRRRITYVDTLLAAARREDVDELKRAMMDRDTWKEFVAGVRPRGRPRGGEV